MGEFFQTLDLPANQLIGNYKPQLVLLSFLVAAAASYIALDFTGQLRSINNNTTKWLWLIGGSIAMGAGIWSMHFIGMLSFSIPGVILQYDLFWTGFSLVIAIIASSFALYLLQTSVIRVEHFVGGGIILGLSIASMHYTGMEAMYISLDIRYLPIIFIISILIAILASLAAIWLALQSVQVSTKYRVRIKVGSALIMGLAICGMHYTGMAASIFTPLCTVSSMSSHLGMDQTYLSAAIAAVTFMVLGIALFASMYKEALNQQLIEKARQLGMAEISVSVLHSVGNILNSIFISINILSESIATSKLDRLEKICNKLNEHQYDLATFITQDPQGVKTLDFLNALSKYWQEEQKNIMEEISTLNKNIVLIQDTISTQQELSKTNDFEVTTSLNALINEALLITGLNQNKEIIVNKYYAKLHLIKIDKVNFLQILINLLSNAKDAVLESDKADKIIDITTTRVSKHNKIRIEISDNGIGIISKNLKKIFTYGFTTKKSGHGFGLHTTAIAIHNLGGTIQVHSDGPNKGASFVIEV